MICHLARSVEAAGGWLQVLGLRDGKEPWGDLDGGAATRPDEPWHFEDKSIMLKKHHFLARALREIPANSTVVFVDAFDTLFQRPLEDLVAAYRRVAGPSAAASDGRWPVVYGGEVNCWPFPHEGELTVRDARRPGSALFRHHIPEDASLSAEHNGGKRFVVGRGHKSVRGDQVCSEWLTQQQPWDEAAGRTQPGAAAPYPFLCAGTFVGTAGSLRRLLRRMFLLYRETGEYHDQALLALLLLRNHSLGMVDSAGEIFLGLHGHEEFEDLERPLCRGSYFAFDAEVASRAPENQADWRPQAPVLGYRPTRSLAGLVPPAVLRGTEGRTRRSAPPAVVHFNGNGKRHLLRCISEFSAEGILGQPTSEAQRTAARAEHAASATHQAAAAGEEPDMPPAECTYLDHDRKSWRRYGVKP